LHCKTDHSPSGAEPNTDTPKDNQGRGESFSPTDLAANVADQTSLGISKAGIEVRDSAWSNLKQAHLCCQVGCGVWDERF
jgi:hypothetical protein